MTSARRDHAAEAIPRKLLGLGGAEHRRGCARASPVRRQVVELGAVVDEPAVRFVDNHEHVVAAGDLRDPGELLAGEDFAGRILRIGEQQQPDAIAREALELVEVNVPAPSQRVIGTRTTSAPQ